MKFIHISDLHFGKTLYEHRLVNEDQPHFADSFISLCAEEKPDAVVIAGDVYDRGIPSSEAVKLMDSFITGINSLGIPILMVAGNHDSGQRLEFGGNILEKEKIHIAGTLDDGLRLKKVTLTDEFGEVDFWLMPYVFPALVADRLRMSADNEDDVPEINNYDDAVRVLLSAQDIDFSRRSVLIAHQNVIDSESESGNIRGGSESMIGGVGGISYTVFDGFTYVALGHIHAAQYVGREGVRYCGTPLCYSFGELRQSAKGPVIVTLGENGTEPKTETRLIEPLHRMRDISGKYADIIEQEKNNGPCGEYVRVVLDGENVTGKISSELHSLFESKGSVLLSLESKNRVLTTGSEKIGNRRAKTTADMFAEFYTEMTGNSADDFTGKVIEYFAQFGRDDSAEADEDEVERFVDYLSGLSQSGGDNEENGEEEKA